MKKLKILIYQEMLNGFKSDYDNYFCISFNRTRKIIKADAIRGFMILRLIKLCFIPTMRSLKELMKYKSNLEGTILWFDVPVGIDNKRIEILETILYKLKNNTK